MVFPGTSLGSVFVLLGRVSLLVLLVLLLRSLLLSRYVQQFPNPKYVPKIFIADFGWFLGVDNIEFLVEWECPIVNKFNKTTDLIYRSRQLGNFSRAPLKLPLLKLGGSATELNNALPLRQRTDNKQ